MSESAPRHHAAPAHELPKGTGEKPITNNLPEGDYTVVASGYPPAASRMRVSSSEPHTHDVQLTHPEA